MRRKLAKNHEIILGRGWINLKWPSETSFLRDEIASAKIEPPPPLGIISSQPSDVNDRAFIAELQNKKNPQMVISDVRPKYEIDLSIKTSFLENLPNIWTWELNSSWVGSTQSRTRRMFVAAQKTFFPMKGCACYRSYLFEPLSAPNRQFGFSITTPRKKFLDGTVSLLEPKLGNAHEPILLGKLTPRQYGATQKRNPSGVQYNVYSSEGTSSPLGDCFPPSGFIHTLIFDPHHKRVRPLSTQECCALIGGNIIDFPMGSYSDKEFGTLFLHTNPPEFCHYQLSLSEGLFDYITFNPSSVRTGMTPSYITSFTTLGKAKFGRAKRSDLQGEKGPMLFPDH